MELLTPKPPIGASTYTAHAPRMHYSRACTTHAQALLTPMHYSRATHALLTCKHYSRA